MPRGSRPDNAVRNAQIYAEWIRKPNLPELAAKWELTPQRIGQIVANFNPDLETEYERALLKGGLWNLVHELQGVIDQPGYKLAPNGRLATDDDGEPIPDVMAKVEAIKVKGNAYKQIAQLVGAEKPVVQRHSHEFYENQAAADIAQRRAQVELDAADRQELERLRRQLTPVVPGEVIRELPAAEG